MSFAVVVPKLSTAGRDLLQVCAPGDSPLANAAPSTRWKNLKTQQSRGNFDSCLRKTRSGKSRDYRDVMVFKKPRFQNVFRPHY